jgi:hypothetical protein
MAMRAASSPAGPPPAINTFFLTIAPAPLLTITPTSPLPTGTVNVAYSQTLAATGGIRGPAIETPDPIRMREVLCAASAIVA